MKSSLPRPIITKKIIQENFKTKTFVTNISLKKAKPGQFIMIWLPQIAEKPFSITDNNPLSFTVMSVGKFTKRLNTKIKVGDKVWYRGPFGKGVYQDQKGKKILIAGGCGCVPLYFFAKSLKSIKNTQVVIGAKTKKELLFEKRFRKLGFKSFITTDDGSQGLKGYTTDVLQKMLKKNKLACVYSCGPEPMLKKIANICKLNKIKYQLSLEALMKCGFGICGSCSCEEKLVCLDGPVFTKWPK
ncbi:dihydroorotate dehydrogenase electron transfer subunit [Patescibacteria group bacterium]